MDFMKLAALIESDPAKALDTLASLAASVSAIVKMLEAHPEAISAVLAFLPRHTA